MTPPLDARVDQLLIALFGRSALEVTNVHSAEGDPDAVRACADVLRVQGYTNITVEGTRITVRT